MRRIKTDIFGDPSPDDPHLKVGQESLSGTPGSPSGAYALVRAEDDDDDESINRSQSLYRVQPLVEQNVPKCYVKYQGKNAEGGDHYLAMIFNAVFDFENYLNLIALLETAEDGTTMDLLINSPGGCLVTGTTLASAISRSKAFVTTINLGTAASIAATVWSAGDRRVMDVGARVMFHMSSHGDMGNSRMIGLSADALAKYVETCLLDVPLKLGILTEEELNSITQKGKDVYLTYDVLKERGVEVLIRKGDQK